jgi:hypothetical protein
VHPGRGAVADVAPIRRLAAPRPLRKGSDHRRQVWKRTPDRKLGPTGGQTREVDGPSFTTLLAEALAHAARHGGAVRVEQLDAGWETSIVIGSRRVAIARDEYLEAALIRLNAQLAAPSVSPEPSR